MSDDTTPAMTLLHAETLPYATANVDSVLYRYWRAAGFNPHATLDGVLLSDDGALMLTRYTSPGEVSYTVTETAGAVVVGTVQLAPLLDGATACQVIRHGDAAGYDDALLGLWRAFVEWARQTQTSRVERGRGPRVAQLRRVDAS